MAKTEEIARPITALQQFQDKRPKAKDIDTAALLERLTTDGDLVAASELGDGWTVLNKDEKAQLIGVPFIVVDWQFNDGDNGRFVSASVIVVKTGQCFIVNDGSTGIFRQLEDFMDGNANKALYCKHGLRVSEYTYTSPEGEERPAKTYYINTSA